MSQVSGKEELIAKDANRFADSHIECSCLLFGWILVDYKIEGTHTTYNNGALYEHIFYSGDISMMSYYFLFIEGTYVEQDAETYGPPYIL